ncbi:twin-arginine translocation signal domain-containing protein, partial [Chloroflexota bacterium]
MSIVTRRDFLKLSSAASAGLVLAACGKGKSSAYA